MTGTGKSYLSRRLYLSAAAPRMVIDPADSDLTHTPGCVTIRDARRLPSSAATVRFVPSDPFDLDAYDAAYRWAFSNYPRFIWLDEAGIAAPAHGAPRGLKQYLVQGRKRSLGHLACHTRPREVERNLIAQSAHVIVFSLPNPDDRQVIAAQAGVPARVLDHALTTLPEFGFIWFDQRRQTLTTCPPLK